MWTQADDGFGLKVLVMEVGFLQLLVGLWIWIGFLPSRGFSLGDWKALV